MGHSKKLQGNPQPKASLLGLIVNCAPKSEQCSNLATGSDAQHSNLSTSNLPSSTFVTVPSSQLEETQRELRELREIVSVLRAASNDNVHAAPDTESVDFTPPPDYATERGSFMPIIQNEAV